MLPNVNAPTCPKSLHFIEYLRTNKKIFHSTESHQTVYLELIFPLYWVDENGTPRQILHFGIYSHILHFSLHVWGRKLTEAIMQTQSAIVLWIRCASILQMLGLLWSTNWLETVQVSISTRGIGGYELLESKSNRHVVANWASFHIQNLWTGFFPKGGKCLWSWT